MSSVSQRRGTRLVSRKLDSSRKVIPDVTPCKVPAIKLCAMNITPAA